MDFKLEAAFWLVDYSERVVYRRLYQYKRKTWKGKMIKKYFKKKGRERQLPDSCL